LLWFSEKEREQINNDQLDFKELFKDDESRIDCSAQSFIEPKDFHDDVQLLIDELEKVQSKKQDILLEIYKMEKS